MTSSLARKFERTVRAGAVVRDSLWGQQVDAFNIQIRVPASEPLTKIVQTVRGAAGAEVREIPSSCLHISVLWIVAARFAYPLSRVDTWNSIAAPCVSAFKRVVSGLGPFSVRFNEVVATDTAILLLGHDAGQMAELRRQLAKALPLPPQTKNQQDIIHLTMFRYASRLTNPEGLWKATASQRPDIAVDVTEVEIRHEVIYPSLVSRSLCRAALGSGRTNESNYHR